MKIPVHESEVENEVWYAGTDREIFGKALCDVGGRARVGVGLLELPCGTNTQPAHWHSLEEEQLFKQYRTISRTRAKCRCAIC